MSYKQNIPTISWETHSK